MIHTVFISIGKNVLMVRLNIYWEQANIVNGEKLSIKSTEDLKCYSVIYFLLTEVSIMFILSMDGQN